jgi:hypothetical protein
MNYDMQKKLQTAVISGYATNIPVRITRATTAIAADTSTFFLTTEFVVVVIVRDTNLNFRYNPLFTYGT